MWIRFICSKCGKRFKVDERSAGKKGRCPCGNHIHIPEGKRTLGTGPTHEPLETTPEHGWVFSRESRSKALACIGSAMLATILAIWRATVDNNGITVGVVLVFLFSWVMFYWSFRRGARKRRKKNTINGTTHHAGSPRESDAKIASGLPESDTTKEIYPRHRSLKKVGLLVGGVAILSGIVWMVIYFSSSGNESMDNHVPDKKVRLEAEEKNPPIQRVESKPNAPTALRQEIMSIPQLAMNKPLTQTSYSQIQRQCELVLANSPDSTQVRSIWEQVRFHKKCNSCRGFGTEACKQCKGRGIQHVSNGFKEETLPIFTYAVPKTMTGFDYQGGGYFQDGSLQECSLIFGIMSVFRVSTLMPTPFPDGLIEHVKWIRPSQVTLYKCRNCNYYDMPMLVEPFFPNSIQMSQYQGKKLQISFPKTYEWTGKTGTKIFLRLQKQSYDRYLQSKNKIDGFNINPETNTDARFMQPLEACPKCGRSEYILKTPLTREVECNECGGKGKVGPCTACQGSGVERLSKARELATIVSLENRLSSNSIRVEFIGKTYTLRTTLIRQKHVPAYLYPGKYRMLLTYNDQGVDSTPRFAVSEEIEIKHHATYVSEPVFILAPEGQGNIRLTKVTRQEFDHIKNQTRTPVLLTNTLKQTPIIVTFVGKLKHSSTRRTITLLGGKSLRIHLSPGWYCVLVKYDYQHQNQKPEFAKTAEFEIKERMAYPSEPVFDFTSKGQSNIELVPISEKTYMELNPQPQYESSMIRS